MTAAIRKKKQIVVLAADSGSYSMASVELALQLAASIDRRLHGLFIEDEDLLQVSGLPCTREISLTTGRERPTGIEQMRRSMRSLAEQFRRELEHEARALKIKLSFDTIRGRAREIGLSSAADAAFTVFSQPSTQLLTLAVTRRKRRILVLADETRNQLRALRVVLDRFRGDGVEVVVAGEGGGDEFTQDLEKLIRKFGKDFSLTEISRAGLFDSLARPGPAFDCAIVARSEPAGELARVLQKVRGPVVLVA